MKGTDIPDSADVPIVIDDGRVFLLPDMPAAVQRLYRESSAELQGFLLQLLAIRGAEYVAAHIGVLQNQAEYIDSL
jgi:hypothetical protein